MIIALDSIIVLMTYFETKARAETNWLAEAFLLNKAHIGLW